MLKIGKLDDEYAILHVLFSPADGAMVTSFLKMLKLIGKILLNIPLPCIFLLWDSYHVQIKIGNLKA